MASCFGSFGEHLLKKHVKRQAGSADFHSKTGTNFRPCHASMKHTHMQGHAVRTQGNGLYLAPTRYIQHGCSMICAWSLRGIYSTDVQWFVLGAYQVQHGHSMICTWCRLRYSMDVQWFVLGANQVQHGANQVQHGHSMICTWCLPGLAKYSMDAQCFVLGFDQVQHGCSMICTWCLPGTAWMFNGLYLVLTRYSMDIQFVLGAD